MTPLQSDGARRLRPAGAMTVFLAALAATGLVSPRANAQPDDHPDLNGIYFPAGFARRTPQELPYTPGAAAMAEYWEENFRTEDEPGRFCIWPGMPRAPWGAPFPVEIFHRDYDVTIYWEGYGMFRKIYMEDHNPPEAILPSAMGHSLAHWDGDTLVIETSHLKPYPYMSRFPTTSNARVTERMHLTEREVDGEMKKFLVDDITVVDPQLYTEPVKIHAEAQFRPDLNILEYTCSVTLWEQYLEDRGLTLPDIDALPGAPD